MSIYVKKGGSLYTDEQRREAAVQYAHKGNLAVLERELGIPDSTLHQWKSTDWWDEIVGEVRSQNQDQHIIRYHTIVNKALAKAEAGIDNLGDKLTATDIKALTVAAAASTDKSRLLSGLSTSNPGAKLEGIAELKAQFEALAANHVRIESTVISTQPSDDKG